MADGGVVEAGIAEGAKGAGEAVAADAGIGTLAAEAVPAVAESSAALGAVPT